VAQPSNRFQQGEFLCLVRSLPHVFAGLARSLSVYPIAAYTTMPDINEQLLLERCKSGDRPAFDSLVRLYEKRVYNLAYRLSGNYDEANDISVDAFLRVYQALKLFRGDAHFSTWLFRIVTNVYLDRRKRMRNKQHLSLEEYIELEENSVARQVEDSSPTPVQVAENNERSQLLQAAINDLPDYQRAMVVLYHTEGLSYDEIATIFSLPIGTVKSRLNRARLTLKNKLEPLKELFGN
jgi:RNA polymerase sigma-70 factor (ECF subfamily)